VFKLDIISFIKIVFIFISKPYYISNYFF